MSNSDQLYFSRHVACEDLSRLLEEYLPQEIVYGHSVEHSKGDYVWRQGDAADSIFLLRNGQIAEKITDTKGNELIMKIIGEGESFGELCFCTEGNGERRTSACAVVPSDVIKIGVEEFIKFLQKNHEALKSLLFTFCIRLAEAERRMEVLAYRSAEERLGRLLLSLASSQGKKEVKGDSVEVSLPFSHEELAQMAAMSRAHTTVTMGKLRKQGVISYKRGQPVVVNIQALTKLLDEKR